MKYVCHCGNPTDNEETIGTITVHTCDECKRRIHQEVGFQSEGEQFRENTVICPHCGHEYDTYDAYGFDEGEHEEVTCDCCGKKFDLEVEDIRYFNTKKSLCEMPEDYDPDAEVDE